MTGGVVNIGYVELVGASLLMLVAGIVSWRMGLGQSRRIAVSTVRAFLQLLAMGLLLGYLFKYQTWWLVCLVLLGMCIAATQIATGRTNKVVRGLWADVFLSITVSSMVIAFIVVEGIIHADPWYNAMQLVPISGMILGNTLAAAAVATDRLFASMDSRANEIYMMVALGATPREAAFPSIKAAVGAGMTPLLAQLSADVTFRARPPSWQAYGMPTGWREAVGRRGRSRTMGTTLPPNPRRLPCSKATRSRWHRGRIPAICC